MSKIRIRIADLQDVEVIAPVFDDYRCAFGASSDMEKSRQFIQSRLANSESIIFVAETVADNSIIGFVQLYPSFASIAAARIFILNDMYVKELYRRQGIGRMLLREVHQYARDTGAIRITLITEHINTTAQALYEAEGYVLDTAFRRYLLRFKPPTQHPPP